MIVGVETMLAIATALGTEPYKRGWHNTSITGTFGAAAAIAKLENLSPAQFAATLGHAASMAAGTRAEFGTDTLNTHAGRAAQNGLLAVRMAVEGLGSTDCALEKWVRLIGQGDENFTALSAVDVKSPSDRKWLILENAFKPYPCGIVSHPSIDAGLAAHQHFWGSPGNLVPADNPQDVLDVIKGLEATVTPLTVQLCSVRHPADATQSVFSTYHGIAAGMIYGKAGIREFEMNVVEDPLLTSLRDQITLTTDNKLKEDQASLTVVYKDMKGVEREKTVGRGACYRLIVESHDRASLGSEVHGSSRYRWY